jgi:hypothetical protein
LIEEGFTAVTKILIYILAAIFLIVMINSCAKRKEKEVQVEEQIDIGRVDELTPELFVKITIRYRDENRKWIEKSQSLSLQEQEQYLDEMNEAFFADLGITEEQYTSYGENNAEELDRYVRDHPELMQALMNED